MTTNSDEQWKFNEWVTELADPFWLKDSQKEGEFFDANGFARALLSASKPAAPWIAHWAGSNPYKGWSIRQGRDEVIWFGETISSETVEGIVLAHNKCFDCEGSGCVMNCSGLRPAAPAQSPDDSALRAIMERDAWRNAMVGLCNNSGKWPTTPDEAAAHLRSRLHPTDAAPAQSAEPVAWMLKWPGGICEVFVEERTAVDAGAIYRTKPIPLYAAPQPSPTAVVLDDELEERALLAAGQWANSNTPVSSALAYRDGYLAGAKSSEDQFEYIDVQNHTYRRAMQKIMARLTELLDEDRFAEIEEIVRNAGVEPPPSPTVVLDERAAFEAWCTRNNPTKLFTSYAWMGWKARAASPQPVEQTRALTDDARAKMIADLEAEQTFISSSRERCNPDYELPRWDRLQAVIDHLSGGA